MINLIALLLFCFSTLTAEESEQITVHLSTENHLIPLYAAKFVNKDPTLDANYIQKLEKVLQFDLNHNGMTYSLPQTNENEKLSRLLTDEGISKPKEWRPVAIFYAIKVQIGTDKKISASLHFVNGESIKKIDGIAMTGDLNRDRKQIHQLSDAIYRALFNRDGIASTHLLYALRKRVNDKWTSEIWESDYDGANTRPLIANSSYNITPVYLPPKPGYTASNFFYVSYQSAQPKIFLASVKETSGKRFSYLQGSQLMPAISRQRNKVAFISDITGNPDLFLQSFSTEEGLIGKPQQIFAGKKATQGSPAFNPEASRIAFVSNKDGSPKIYVMDVPAPGTALKDIKVQLVTRLNRESSAPAWSPDGTKLAYCALTDNVRQIWLYDFDTNEERQLTQGPGNKENPSWSPNSLCLVYNCSDAGACELYLININDPEPSKISLGSGEKRFPNWEPK